MTGNYIATFFSHYDALVFFNALKAQDITAKMMPTPRKVSAACGVCVVFDGKLQVEFSGQEIEAIYSEESGSFTQVWTAAP